MSNTFCDGRLTTANHLYQVLVTTIFIFDSAMGLLSKPADEGVMMPSFASMRCIRRMLESSGVGGKDDQTLRSDLLGYLIVR